jgi:hypothetical protein
VIDSTTNYVEHPEVVANRIEQAVDAVEPTGGDAGERRRLLGRQLARPLEHGVAHRPLRQAPKRYGLTARPDRLRERPELVRDEDDDRVLGWLLEVLQQRVRRVLVHQLRFEDDVDAPLRLERPEVQVAPERADVANPDLVAERLEDVEVGMRPAQDAVTLADQLGGEEERRRPLADARRAVEQVRVRRPAGERRAQEPACLRLIAELEGLSHAR